MPGSVSLMTYGAAVSESDGIPEIHGRVDLMIDGSTGDPKSD